MRFKSDIEFANYTLTFGDEKVLLDFILEIVVPSFENQRYVRKTSAASWFFLDTKFVTLKSDADSPMVGIAGRIVKKTKLKRTQIITTDSKLLQDMQELDTAPSSLFLLILNNHRLLYCREMPGAPTLENFCATSSYCLRQAYKDFAKRELGDATELISLSDKGDSTLPTPLPSLRLTPLLHEEELETFVNRFSVIKKLTIKLLKTNEEIYMDDFWQDLNSKRSEMCSESAKVEFIGASEGMDAASVMQEASAAGEYANSEIKIYGFDSEGDKIFGDNADFSLKATIESLSREIEVAAKQMFNRFEHLVRTGHISLPSIPSSVATKIKSFMDTYQ